MLLHSRCLCTSEFACLFIGVRAITAPFFVFTDNSVESNRPVSSFSPQPWHSCHKLIYVRPNPKTGVPVGHWPIPESFWPDQNSPTLVSKEGLNMVSAAPSDCSSVVLQVASYQTGLIFRCFLKATVGNFCKRASKLTLAVA